MDTVGAGDVGALQAAGMLSLVGAFFVSFQVKTLLGRPPSDGEGAGYFLL